MNKKLKAVIALVMLVLILLIVRVFLNNHLTSVADVQNYLKSFGVAAPLALTLFQAFQVVVPVVPGYLGCAAGAVAFGPWVGFLCNYVGISLGSIIAYFLARRFGVRIVLTLFSEKTYNKWTRRLDNSRSYEKFLFAATILPLFPDDFLCYFSGLIDMDDKRFVGIIAAGKPWCILAYSLGFGLLA